MRHRITRDRRPAVEPCEPRELLSAIIDHVSRLQRVDTSAVDETATVGTLVNVWRDDEPEPPFGVEAALANAPDSDGEYFRVGAIQE